MELIEINLEIPTINQSKTDVINKIADNNKIILAKKQENQELLRLYTYLDMGFKSIQEAYSFNINND